MRIALPLLFFFFALPFVLSVDAEASPSTVREVCQTWLSHGFTLDWVTDHECWEHVAGQRYRRHVFESGDGICTDDLYQPGNPGPWYTTHIGCIPRAQPFKFELPKLVVPRPEVKQVMFKDLKPGQEIVAKDTKVEIVFPDGSIVKLDKGSAFTVESETEVQGVFGRFWYLWKHGCHQPKGRCLELKTPNAIAGIKGTEFVAEVNAQTTSFWVLQGSVEVSDPSGKKTVPVPSNQYVTVGNKGVISDPKGFDPRRLSRWWENKTDDFLFLPLLLAGACLIALVRLLGRLASALKQRQVASSVKAGQVLPLLGGVAVVGAAALPWVASWSAIPGFGVVRTFQFMDFPFGVLAAGMEAENAARVGAVLLGVLGGILVLAPGASAARRICGLLAALVACAYATLLGVGTVFGGLAPGAGIAIAFVGGLLLSRSQASRGPQPAPSTQTPG